MRTEGITAWIFYCDSGGPWCQCPVLGAGPSSDVDPRPGRAWAWARAWPRSEPKPPLGRGRIDEGVIWLWGRSTIHFSLPCQCQPLTAQHCALGQARLGTASGSRGCLLSRWAMDVNDDHQSDPIWKLESQETRRTSGYNGTKATSLLSGRMQYFGVLSPELWTLQAMPNPQVIYRSRLSPLLVRRPGRLSGRQPGRLANSPSPCAQTTILLCQGRRCQQASPSISQARAGSAGGGQGGGGHREEGSMANCHCYCHGIGATGPRVKMRSRCHADVAGIARMQ